MDMRHYAHGRLSTNKDISCHKQVEKWIREKQFSRYEKSELSLGKKSRKRNKLYCFYDEHTGSNVVMKVSQVSRDYKFWRRMNLYITSLYKDYNYNSYKGSLKLLKAGVDTIKPIAYWTCKTSWLKQKSYFLYEKIESSLNVNELYNEIIASNPANKNELIDTIADKCIAIVQKIHAANLRHGDPHGGNILTDLDYNDIRDVSTEDIKRARFTLVDNDRCSSSRAPTATLKRFYDIKCLARFNICQIPQQELLRRYLGERHTYWKYVLSFWNTGGFSLRKRIYALLK